MAEKPRAPRQANVVGIGVAIPGQSVPRQSAGRANSHSHEDVGAEVKDQHAKLQEELEKSRKLAAVFGRETARGPSRNCAACRTR